MLSLPFLAQDRLVSLHRMVSRKSLPDSRILLLKCWKIWSYWWCDWQTLWFCFSYLQYATEYTVLLRNTTSGNVTTEKVWSLLRFLYKPLSIVIFYYFTGFNPFQQSLERNKYFSLPGTETHMSQMSYPQPHKKARMDRSVGLNWSDTWDLIFRPCFLRPGLTWYKFW